MGLVNFLKQQGFVKEEPADKSRPEGSAAVSRQPATEPEPPSYFPLTPAAPEKTRANSSGQADPSFVAPLEVNKPANISGTPRPDPSFIKFFEDELVKANLPGPDYFEFRQLLVKTQQKMASKGGAAPEVVLQAVLLSFEAQDITRAKLLEAARHYKEVIKQKNDDFIAGAEKEKSNQLQKRQTVLQSHSDSIRTLQQQLQQLEIQKQQLNESLNKEKTQMEVDKTLGQEGIDKIEKAEKMINLAHDHMQSTIDEDIERLQSV
jgi:uncharacterized protein YktA (UPF0223 family)